MRSLLCSLFYTNSLSRAVSLMLAQRDPLRQRSLYAVGNV
jgi:hypothetical protein